MQFPLLADFAVRLGSGLALILLLTPIKLVPPAFFRTHCQVILGLFVLAALSLPRGGVPAKVELTAVVTAGAVAYFAAISWGLGLPRIGVPLTAVILAGGLVTMVEESGLRMDTIAALDFAARLASSALLGATLSAMLLGHHYLTAPAMSIDPLRRFVSAMGWALGARTVLAAIGFVLWQLGQAPASPYSHGSTFFLAMRWGSGILGTAVATVLAAKTVQIRSTQSATGILYIAMMFVLTGELTAMILTHDVGLAL